MTITRCQGATEIHRRQGIPQRRPGYQELGGWLVFKRSLFTGAMTVCDVVLCRLLGTREFTHCSLLHLSGSGLVSSRAVRIEFAWTEPLA